MCRLGLPKNPIVDDHKAFCCSGCLTVYQIIGSDPCREEHPLFKEALSAGVIANPAHYETEEKVLTGTFEKYRLSIGGMWCPACAEAICLILKRKNGIAGCVVDYATDLAVITFDPCKIGKEEIGNFLTKLGYVPEDALLPERNRLTRSLWLRFAVAAFCTLNIMMFSYPLYAGYFGSSIEGYGGLLGWLMGLLSLPLLFYAALPIWKRLKVSVYSHVFGMETLVAIGVGTAFLASLLSLIQGQLTHLYFDSMAMVITFVLLGSALEKRAKFSAKERLFSLTRSLPKRAMKRLVSGEYAITPLKEIEVGDWIRVRTGEKIALDGIVRGGQGLVDEALLTGEAHLKLKQVENSCTGGSLLRRGVLEIEVTQDRHGSFLGRILEVIEADMGRKGGSERFVDLVTRYFVPSMLALSLLAFYLGGLQRMLTLLLISCPCAMGIATPLVTARLLALFAQKGAFVRNRTCFEVLARTPFFLFDKTGTLTEGKFTIQEFSHSLSQKEQGILKGLASLSLHPISLALAEFLPGEAFTLEEVDEVLGRGVEGVYQGEKYLLGSERFCLERGIQVTSHDKSVVYFAASTHLLTEIHLEDTLRSGLPKVGGAILSGDAPQLVQKIAHLCGLKWGKGGLDPLQKREEVLALKKQKKVVAMVGDGINDAPAMGAADVAISVVSATDVASEVADISLTTKDLSILSDLISLAKKGRSLMFQNLFWAFFYNAIGVGLALFGLLNPLIASLAMIISSLFVTLNTYRLS